MARLRVFDKVGLGEFIIKAARFEGDSRDKLMNEDERLNTLRVYLEIPADRKDEKGNNIKHKIVVLEDTRDVTYMVLPWKDNVDFAMQDIDHQRDIYPKEYLPGSPDYIDDAVQPRKALYFRFGEYMFGRCKT